ncbi:MAG: hypothetical protein HOP16_12550 [Acidobacteria bacterium]|nr:hypothetical protein [Acidobacteriota bacterium]
MDCIVVKRGEFAHFDRLSRAFGDQLPVVWDRRQNPGRPSGGSGQKPGFTDTERRASPPASWDALGFILTHHNPPAS